jgi:hypothetical protein
MMREVVSDAGLVAYCGLYCGACRAYLKERCPGCHENAKATWCKLRACCIERGYKSCADCADFADPMQCGKYNNFISKVVGFLLRSNRAACIGQIKKLGVQGHADAMAAAKKQTIRR